MIKRQTNLHSCVWLSAFGLALLTAATSTLANDSDRILDQDMTKQKLIDQLAKVSENYTVTNCQNGYVDGVSVHDSSHDWITTKYVLKTIKEIDDAV